MGTDANERTHLLTSKCQQIKLPLPWYTDRRHLSLCHCEYSVQDHESYFSVYSGTLKPGMTYTKLIDTDVNVGNVTSIEFIWKEHSFGHSQNKLGAEMVTDISGKYGYK